MTILGYTIEFSAATRRDWRHIKEATGEFFAAFRKPREIAVTLLAAAFLAAFVMAAVLSDDNCCGDPQRQAISSKR